jgi:hypothetical protein
MLIFRVEKTVDGSNGRVYYKIWIGFHEGNRFPGETCFAEAVSRKTSTYEYGG